MAQDLGRQPTPDELAAETGIDREMIATLERTAQTVSLDEVVFDVTGPERIGFIAGDADVEAAAEVTELWARVAERIAQLESVDPRIPQVILEHYVGGRSFVDLAEEFGVSRQRVGQIKDRAVTILRAYLSGDKDLAETWRTRDCEVHNAGPAVTHKV
jgi:RNA polymerase primary sigma factor